MGSTQCCPSGELRSRDCLGGWLCYFLASELDGCFILLLFHQASQAWMEWLMKKRKAFDQRGDMAIAAWAEQQQREMNLRARRLSRSKVLL